MKKSVSVLVSVLLLFSFILTGCGSDSPKSALEGTTWKMTGGKDVSGIEVTEENLAAVGMGDFTLEFKADAAVTASVAGTTSEGTYSENGEEITIEMDGDSITVILKDNVMTMDQDGTTLYFEKQ